MLGLNDRGRQSGRATEHLLYLVRDLVPLLRERYDLLLHRRDFFEPPLASLFAFARGESFAARAARMGGYDVSGLGTMHYNGP